MRIPSRRQVLGAVCRTITLAGTGGVLGRLGMVNALAQNAADYRALVCVFLFGGNDANNLVVPITAAQQGYQQYQSIRGNIALPSTGLLGISAQGGTYGLHPNLAEVQALYDAGKMALVANVGMLAEPLTRAEYLGKQKKVPENLFSHSDQQGQWQSIDSSGTGSSGWAGRVADLLGPAYNTQVPSGAKVPFPLIVSVAGANLFSTGTVSRPAMVTTTGAVTPANWPASPNARTIAVQRLLSFDNGLKLVQAANEIADAGIKDATVMDAALASSTVTTAFPNTSVANQLKIVARIIKARGTLGARRQIFFVSMGGYDNHENLLTTQANNFTQLSQAIAAFQTCLQEINVEPNVTLFTESEFGRTCQPSSGAGSDHAWGSHHMVVGGAVKGGRMYGQFPALALGGPDDAGSRGVWIPTTALDQYGATLASWFGVQTGDLPAVFPNLAKFGSGALGFML